MISRREVLASGAGLAVAGTAAAASIAVDPVVALYKALEVARSVASEKLEHADRIFDTIPPKYQVHYWECRQKVEGYPAHRSKENGMLYGSMMPCGEMTRFQIEKELEGRSFMQPTDDYMARLREGLARLEAGPEAEWQAAREDYERAVEDQEKALEVCDRLEDEIMETPATSPEGIICKVRLGLTLAELHRHPHDGHLDEKTFLSVIEDLKRLPQ